MRTSTVKWFDAKKGYGFIHHPDDGEDVFVHYSNIQSDDDFKTLKSDQHVRFEMNDGPKGLHALEVAPLDDEEAPSSDDGNEPELTPADVDPTATVDPSPSGDDSSSDSSW
ncbi:CspA family cold shock protein [Salinibacter ruber]|uniref:cold-shock protein n=1 Tax=Salinibacter ruber TaxID=146919 RepID=UPI0023430E03|nr:CspA family cold shock protein [Salinibacter ruber]MCS3652350.1 CspA family cold shock protein [Salinibacter ruber]